MRKLKNFTLSSSCKRLNNEMMIEIIGGADEKTCSFNSSQSSCSGLCDYDGHQGSCTYGSIGIFTGCYCYIA
nr:hypothetical protein [uncultured Prevotella sp.]